MAAMDELREGVRRSLPEIAEISNEDLRDKIIEAWALSLSKSQFTRIEQMRCSGMVGSRHIPGLTQADHLRGVGRIARSIAQEMVDLCGNKIQIDPDMALAGGLLHDVGKPLFYDTSNIARWRENKSYTGKPPFRHTMYGAHLALTVGLPEEIAHVIAGHDTHMDGQYIEHSVYCSIVAHADQVYWSVLFRLAKSEKDPTQIKGPAG